MVSGTTVDTLIHCQCCGQVRFTWDVVCCALVSTVCVQMYSIGCCSVNVYKLSQLFCLWYITMATICPLVRVLDEKYIKFKLLSEYIWVTIAVPVWSTPSLKLIRQCEMV